MIEVGFECPICGKYYFQDFDGLAECPVCNWVNDIVQYDNHDFSEGSNILSVNEYMIEYAVLNNMNTKEVAEKLKEDFRSELVSIHEDFRKIKWGLRMDPKIPSCEEIHQQSVTARLKYMAKLNKLLQHC